MIKKRDHPRGCGEHESRSAGAQALAGSSPRMRGARFTGSLAKIPAGIIPADAGSTPHRVLVPRAVQDHPRGCGEHGESYAAIMPALGSSPRMRGARWPSGRRPRGQGIIPADAGSTLWCEGAADTYQDHPRGCGEHRLGL